MNKKPLPGWVGAIVVAVVVIGAVIAGNRAINPPLPPPHVTIMSNPYGAQAQMPDNYKSSAAHQ